VTTTVNLLKRGQRATISQIDVDKIPLKLLEMGCLPGNEIEVVQIAPFGDPIYLNVNNGSHLAIRLETASEIEVEIIEF
jgi:ferrous iron transport protein A